MNPTPVDPCEELAKLVSNRIPGRDLAGYGCALFAIGGVLAWVLPATPDVAWNLIAALPCFAAGWGLLWWGNRRDIRRHREFDQQLAALMTRIEQP